MNEPRHPRAADDAPSRAWLVAMVAAVVPPFWLALVLGREALWLAVPAVLASAWLWYVVARELENVRGRAQRLLAGALVGLVSPVLGVLLTTLCTTLSPCCMLGFVVPGAFGLMVAEPLWFFPFGLGMGLLTALVVAGPPAPPPRAR